MPSGDYTQRRSINEIPLVTVTAIHEWNRGRHDFHFMFFRYYVTSWFLPLLLPYSMLNKCASPCPTPNNLRDARRLTLVKEKMVVEHCSLLILADSLRRPGQVCLIPAHNQTKKYIHSPYARTMTHHAFSGDKSQFGDTSPSQFEARENNSLPRWDCSHECCFVSSRRPRDAHFSRRPCPARCSARAPSSRTSERSE